MHIFFSPFLVEDAGTMARDEMVIEMRDFTKSYSLKKNPPLRGEDWSTNIGVVRFGPVSLPRLQSQRGSTIIFCAVAIEYTGQPYKVLKEISDNDTLLVSGHGHSSFSFISSQPDGGVQLSAQETALRLKQSGLRKDFAGKIKLLMCSGAGGNVAMGEDSSFLEEFASVLGGEPDPGFLRDLEGASRKTYEDSRLGYRDCRIIGYTKPLFMLYKPFSDDRKRRAVSIEDDVGTPGRIQRAKDYRRAFKGGKEVMLPPLSS
jgi:hypothetical protein